MCVGIFALKNRGKPVSAGFIGFAEGKELCEALVGLTNHNSASVRFLRLLTCSRLDKKQSIQVGRPVDVVIEGKAVRTLAVTVPFGAGPARVSCSVIVLGRHSVLVRQLGALLQKAGVHVYHTGGAAPAPASNPRPPLARLSRYAVMLLSHPSDGA